LSFGNGISMFTSSTPQILLQPLAEFTSINAFLRFPDAHPTAQPSQSQVCGTEHRTTSALELNYQLSIHVGCTCTDVSSKTTPCPNMTL
jgi:hypothetical protein